MGSNWKMCCNTVIPVLLGSLLVLVFSSPIQVVYPSPTNLEVNRQPKTIDMMNNMAQGMDFLKDMIRNGMPYRPVPPPFPALRNLFKAPNGTSLTWVPLGSLLFNNNGKIIGG